MSRPLPEPTETSRPFWSACCEGKLLLQSCRSCGRPQFYPRALCTHCLSDRLDWIEAKGRGEVYSYTIVERALMAGFIDEIPYVVAMIQLDEGVRLLSRLIDCDPDLVSIGMPVTVVFAPVSVGIAIPYFKPLVDEAQSE